MLILFSRKEFTNYEFSKTGLKLFISEKKLPKLFIKKQHLFKSVSDLAEQHH